MNRTSNAQRPTSHAHPVHLLVGPAGSGKTARIVRSVLAALEASSEGAPLLLLAPKQATFLLERQLLAEGPVQGFTRLRILSLPRLAERILESSGAPRGRLLSDEGRIMVLRSILARVRDELTVYRATARLPGFARQLGDLLLEFQQYQISPERLAQLAATLSAEASLPGRLTDLGRLLAEYENWLGNRGVQDDSRLLALASQALAAAPATAPGDVDPLLFGGLWMDGFAEMTPPELDLLAALVPRCPQATLAFCLEHPDPDPVDCFSPWSVVGHTLSELRRRLAALPELSIRIETLPRRPGQDRWPANAALGHFEAHWAGPTPFTQPWPESPDRAPPIRLVRCANFEAEAVVAAREILRFVRDEGGRYRDTAVLVRSLDDHAAAVCRVFARYDIPAFLDRRENATHHPLAELARGAVRLAAFGWRQDDWLAILKTGLLPAPETDLDRLENEALARGWDGTRWLEPLPATNEGAHDLESLRSRLVPPFAAFRDALIEDPAGISGRGLVDALRGLWDTLGIHQRLDDWAAAPEIPGVPAQVHRTVFDEIERLLEDLVLAFHDVVSHPSEWLAVLEAGLGNLTVGVVPPAIDQVLVGAVDRSRNPELRLAVLLGWNEGLFPAIDGPGSLLSETDRQSIEQAGTRLGRDRRRTVGRERFYAYIAGTRARDRMVITFAERNTDDGILNPSPFVRRLLRLFPSLPIETPDLPDAGGPFEHASELVVPLLRAGPTLPPPARAAWRERVPALARWEECFAQPVQTDLDAGLPPPMAAQLYGDPTLRLPVTRLEEFAACPFRFFVNAGLRATERLHFDLDARKIGSFHHEVLAQFHRELEREGRPWRSLSTPAARRRIARIAETVAGWFESGVLHADPLRRFRLRTSTRALQDFVATTVDWMRTSYGFDPHAAELSLGGPGCDLPAWALDLGDDVTLLIHGKIDRVDLAPAPDGPDRWFLVIDYKTRARPVDPRLLEAGIQIQLPAYLGALRGLAQTQPLFGANRLRPVGMFQAGLHVRRETGKTRNEALHAAEASRRKAYRHRGRFDRAALPVLDRLSNTGSNSGQFSHIPQGRGGRSADPMTTAEFEALLDRAQARLIALGRDIRAGVARVAPYRKGNDDTACHTCAFGAICRFDPWTHEYRRV